MDREAMLAHFAGDEGLFAEAIGVFLEDCPMRLAQVRSALDDGEPLAIRTSAHALKGLAGILTARALFDAAHDIEQLGDAAQVDAARAAWPRLTEEAAAVMDDLKSFL